MSFAIPLTAADRKKMMYSAIQQLRSYWIGESKDNMANRVAKSQADLTLLL